MQMFLGIAIGALIGGTIGIVLMSLIKINKKDAIESLKIINKQFDREKQLVVREGKKSSEYIEGMDKIIKLFNYFFEEELR